MAGELPSGDAKLGPGQPASEPTGPVNQQSSAPQEGTGTTADLESKIAEIEAESKRNISRLQSSLMSQQTQREQAWEREKSQYEDQLAQAYMSSMDEKERSEYERDLLRSKLERYEEQIALERSQREAYANMNTYAQWFSSMGVDSNKLDWSSPEALAQSGTDALTQHVKSLNERLTQYERGQPQAAPTSQSLARTPATPVVTSNAGTPSTAATFEDVRKALSEQAGRELTDEDVFKAAERNPNVRAKLTELATVEAERRALARGS